MPDSIKKNGVHYTPAGLASFLARSTLAVAQRSAKRLDILDPACGDGGLLTALVEALPKRDRKNLNLFGFEQDAEAARSARENLARLNVNQIDIRERDFLEVAGVESIRSGGPPIDHGSAEAVRKFDVVIANPPYVRTQVLGADRAQVLGKRFGLTGRVDLSHAFSIAMSNVLHDGGTLGLLTSNRFLTIKSGINLRRFFQQQFEIKSIIDLGDTKLFAASVLPVIVVAKKSDAMDETLHAKCRYIRIYECRGKLDQARPTHYPHVLDAVEDNDFSGLVETDQGVYEVQRGSLCSHGEDQIWTVATPENTDWLATVQSHQRYTFSDIAHVRVGIKTTADSVFIREQWQSVPQQIRPEKTWLRPLITHHDARQWSITDGSTLKTVIYPHESRDGVRVPIKLSRYPKTKSYFDHHGDRLRSRKYVIESGREWFEIWVPHHPGDWTKRKIVFPDIAERPTFFLDESGSIVNGDCYWMTLKPDLDEDWLYLILAVANSSFMEKFYDLRFHNKLYAGRRRFMTQYVKQFPLPDLKSDLSREIVRLVKKLLLSKRSTTRDRYASQIEPLLQRSFGIGRLTNHAVTDPTKLSRTPGRADRTGGIW